MSQPFEVIDLEPFEVRENPTETQPGDVVYQWVTGASDPTSEQLMRIVEQSGTLDFWDNPAEDLYSEEDGRPV